LTEKHDFELALRIGKICPQGNLEQNARTERYQFLCETAENLRAPIVLTAHTINDQAESILLNLIRGSGLQGLGGIKTKRELEKGSEILLVRPMLNWAMRSDTENFCLENEIHFRRDAMNEDLTFGRVRVRKILLPMLKEFNPKIIETLAKTASLLREDFDALEIFVEQKSTNSVRLNFENDLAETRGNSLTIKDLKELSPAIRRLIVRRWLKIERGDLRKLTTKHFESVEILISSRKSGKTVELPDGESVSKKKGKLIFSE
jgi:tRNA(Ile)-lysidine synthase